MNGVVTCSFLGRLGNNLFTYCFARAHAERVGAEFQCDPWLGQQIFQLGDKPIVHKELPRRSEQDLKDDETWVSIYGYAQCQKALIYTRRQVREWFRFRPEVAGKLAGVRIGRMQAHRRVGDYLGYSYPVVSKASYARCVDALGMDHQDIDWVTEEEPYWVEEFNRSMPWLPDFWRMVHAPILLRGNSCFSWWAGTLGSGDVYSPVVAGLVGGREHDVPFVFGNWPRFTDICGITDLHLPE